MFYLTRMLGKPVVDASGEQIGTINDVAIATGEIFPRVTSLAFLGPDKTPFMLSWRKFVDEFDEEGVKLTAPASDLRFSYLQPDEVLIARDLLNKQIVDTQGMKVVRVNDLKLSESRNQLRLLGADVGLRGILRSLWPPLESAADRVARVFGARLSENLIAWNYMDLLDRDLSHVKLSVTHKRLHELHPADVADVLEQLTASQRARVFEHLDNDQAAEAISELEDELQAEVLDDLTNQRASDILEIMDPDDAADIIGDLPYDKAETLLRLMGVREARQVRKLLGYKENTAGGIMTPEITTVTEEMTVQEVIELLRTSAAEHENIYYIYVVGPKRVLEGVISLRDLIVSPPETRVADIVERELFTVNPDDDQEQVAETMSKYDLLALPVVDETGRILGMVTVDDALDVMEQESAEDLAIATGTMPGPGTGMWRWIGRRTGWAVAWLVSGLAFSFIVGFRVRSAAAVGGNVADVRWTLALIGLFLPLVLRVAEEISGRAVAGLIEGEQPDAGGAWRRFVGDMAVGAVLGLLSGAGAFVVAELALVDEGWLAGIIGISTGLAVLGTAAIGAGAREAAAAGVRAGRAVSASGLTILLVFASAILYGALGFVTMLLVRRVA